MDGHLDEKRNVYWFTMWNIIKSLPVDLVATHLLCFLRVMDCLKLERATGSHESRNYVIDLFKNCTASFDVPHCYMNKRSLLKWLAKRKFRIKMLQISLPMINHSLDKELNVDRFQLFIHDRVSMKDCEQIKDPYIQSKIEFIDISAGYVSKETMLHIGKCTPNITSLQAMEISNSDEWLTKELLDCWACLQRVWLDNVSAALTVLVAESCPALVCIKLNDQVDDAVVVAIADNCPHLQHLALNFAQGLTYTSLLRLSEHSLPINILDMQRIPRTPTSEIAKRCAHALSCIRYLDTNYNLSYTPAGEEKHEFLLSQLTNLTSLSLSSVQDCHYAPTLAQHCRGLQSVHIDKDSTVSVEDLAALFRVNVRLNSISMSGHYRLGDTGLCSLAPACPHLHTLSLSYETDITDTGILALSEHCPQLRRLEIQKCKQVTEAAVLQLLQRCLQLKSLTVSVLSLSDWRSHQLHCKYKGKLCICRVY